MPDLYADDNGKETIRLLDRAKSDRANFNTQWQDIRNLVRINTSDFNGAQTPGEQRALNIFDGTAPWALEQFAAGLNNASTSATERWFNLGIAEMDDGGMSDEELLWCEVTADRIYREYGKPEVSLNSSLHEIYQDLGGFGTGSLYQDWNWQGRHIQFRAFPLADCYIRESASGMVNEMFRRLRMTVVQIMEEFSEDGDTIPAKFQEEMRKNPYKEFWICNRIYPRKQMTAGYGPKNKRFASCWVIEELKATLRERGYDSFPYHVPRWTKMAGEVYGRSPAMNCLPDIKMVNAMSKVIIRGAQKMIDPPLIVPDDGFLLPIKTHPGALIFKSAGQEDTVQPLLTGGRPDIGLDMMEQRRDHIIKTFYVDWIIRGKKKERQTQVEIMDDRNEMLRQMGPMLGRLQTELNSPMLMRSYELLNAAGQIPRAPARFAGRLMQIYYISPAAKAQFGTKAVGIQQFVQDLAQLAPIDNTIMDNIDPDVLAQELSKIRDVTRKVIRAPDVIAQIRAKRAQQQQVAAAAAIGGQAASAAKDVSIAQKNGLGMS